MATSREHSTAHTLTIAAPPAVVYGLVADVSRWPALFGPAVYVRQIELTERSQHFEIWAIVNGDIAHWESRRSLDPSRLRIEFAQVRSQHPVEAMRGEWICRELAPGRTEVTLGHTFTAADDRQSTVESIRRALNSNSSRELAALAAAADHGYHVSDVVFSFSDSVDIDGSQVGAAYEFIDRAELWPSHLPHVASADCAEMSPGVQRLTMDSRTDDGTVHTTESLRICRPGEWIAYKQLRTPALLRGHSGVWTFRHAEHGPGRITARHTVVLDPHAAVMTFGSGGVGDAKKYVREQLRRNSSITMTHAVEYARKVTVRP
ncbi:aromatase/cyclase [Nocardia transvalensis]|uniref:aromatase/cyclase n=1 Tax=Nocardia transvalensis TaxID=37333 RepID=UPI001893B2DA|nr:aromatase/cyclase [Nocardia transvalensis]MBF6328253.1 aromatase/cyclase [Nocardia transvalensis]